MTPRRCHASTFHEQMTKETPKNFLGRFFHQNSIPELSSKRPFPTPAGFFAFAIFGMDAAQLAAVAREAALATAVHAMPETMQAAQRHATRSRQSRQRLTRFRRAWQFHG